MKRTCNNCRAIMGGICGLGKKNKRIFTEFCEQYKPLEECDKPLTYSNFIYLLNLKNETKL